MTPEEIARASADRMWELDAVSAAQGMELMSVGPGDARVTMRVRPNMLNAHKMCHGGPIFTLADTAFAYACNSYGVSTVAQHCSITYLAPALVGDKLTATASEVSRRGRSGIFDIRITNQAGEAIAEFRGHSRTIKGTHLPE